MACQGSLRVQEWGRGDSQVRLVRRHLRLYVQVCVLKGV